MVLALAAVRAAKAIAVHEIESENPHDIDAELSKIGLSGWVVNQDLQETTAFPRMKSTSYNSTMTITADQYELSDTFVKEEFYWKVSFLRRLNPSEFLLPSLIVTTKKIGALVRISSASDKTVNLRSLIDRMSGEDLRSYFVNLTKLLESLESKGGILSELTLDDLGVIPSAPSQPILVTLAHLSRLDAKCYVSPKPGQRNCTTTNHSTLFEINEKTDLFVVRESLNKRCEVTAERSLSLEALNKVIEASPLSEHISNSDILEFARGKATMDKKSLARFVTWEGLREKLQEESPPRENRKKTVFKRVFGNEKPESPTFW